MRQTRRKNGSLALVDERDPVPRERDWNEKLLGWSHVGFRSRRWGTRAARCGENSGDSNDNEFHDFNTLVCLMPGTKFMPDNVFLASTLTGDKVKDVDVAAPCHQIGKETEAFLVWKGA